jgi:lantibiotic modifying enzyme
MPSARRLPCCGCAIATRSPDRSQQLLGDVRLAMGLHAPCWIATFAWMFKAMTRGAGYLNLSSRTEPPLPFDYIFIPVVKDAWEQCQQVKENGQQILTSTAQCDLKYILLKRLCALCAPSLFDEFCLFRMFSSGGLGGLSAVYDGNPNSRSQYDAFLNSLVEGQLRLHFIERPVLARAISTVTNQWISATDELIRRLASDLSAIAEAFNNGTPLGPAVKIVGPLSDSHHSGRFVMALSFLNKLTICYKPRELSPDQAWAFFRLAGQARGPAERPSSTCALPFRIWLG